MNRSPHQPNSGLREIARREWQARQEANRAKAPAIMARIASAPVRKESAK